MKGKVKCTCGWSWNKSDSSAKDMYICHECGRDNSKNIPKAQEGIKSPNVWAQEQHFQQKKKQDEEYKKLIGNTGEEAIDIVQRFTPWKHLPGLGSTFAVGEAVVNNQDPALSDELGMIPFWPAQAASLMLLYSEKEKENFKKFAENRDRGKTYDELLNDEKERRNKEERERVIDKTYVPKPKIGELKETKKETKKEIKKETKSKKVPYTEKKETNKVEIDNTRTVKPQVNNNYKPKSKPETKYKFDIPSITYSDKSFVMPREVNDTKIDNTYVAKPKQKNGGWLDQYADGGTMQEHQENYNDSQASAPEGMVGDGFSNVGRNYSPAWGGQFKEGGKVDPPRRRVIAESTGVYKKPFNEKELKNIIKDDVEYKRTGDVKKPRAEANKFEKYLPTKETVDFFKKLKKDLRPAAFKEALQIQHERGNPSINVGTDKGLPFHARRNYNPFTNEINIPKGLPDSYDDINNYMEEVGHAGQPLSEVIPRFLTNDIPGYIKAYTSEGDIDDNIEKYVYDNPNAVENYTHSKLQPELEKRVEGAYVVPISKEEEAENIELYRKYQLKPNYQMGGYVYPVNYVPQAQGGANLNTPENWEKSIRNIEHQIGNPNEWSIDNYRQLQKQINEYKFWRENTPEGKAVYDSHNEPNEYVVPLPNHLKIYKPLNMLEEVTPNYQMGGFIPQAQEGIKMPSRKDYKTQGQYNAALRQYKLNLRKYELNNNPEKLKGESDKDYENRTKYFKHKVRQEENKNPVSKAYLEMKDDQNADPNPVTKAIRQIFTSPIHVAHGIYNAANPKGLDKYKSRATKNNEDIDLVSSSLDAVSLGIPFDYGMKAIPLWLQALKRTGEEVIEDTGFDLIKQANEYINSFQTGGFIPGAVGFTYARTKGIPSNGPYAKKTMASAQNGKEMRYYQEGLDWQPKTISKNGGWLDGYDVAQGGYTTGDKVTYGTPEYTEAYNKGEVITDEGGRSPILLDEVVVEGKPLTEFGKTRKEIAAKNKWEDYAQKYLGNFEKNMGQTLENLPESRKQEYEDYVNKLAFDEYIKTHPQVKGEERGAYIDRIQAENANSSNFERAYEANADYNDATDINKWRKFLVGLNSIMVPKPAMDYMKQHSDYYSTKEKQAMSENPISTQVGDVLGTLEPLTVPVESLYGDKSFGDIASGQSANIPMTARILGDPLMLGFEAAPLIGSGFRTAGRALGIEEGLLSKFKPKQNYTLPEIESELNLNVNQPRFNQVRSAPRVKKKLVNQWEDKQLDNGLIEQTPLRKGINEDVVKKVTVPGKGHITLKTSTDTSGNPTYYFSADVSEGGLWAGKAYKHLEKFIPKGSKILENKSLSTDSFYNVMQRAKNPKQFTWVDEGQFVPLNNAGKNKVFSNSDKIVPGSTNVKFEDYNEAMKALAEFNSRITIEGMPKAKLSKIVDDFQPVKDGPWIKKTTFGIDVPNIGLIKEYKQGGIIKDDRGQWDHPGEITEIGSNQITMEGVPYPVLGISDTGDTKLMKPGKNYKFKGKKVTEFPMAKNGIRQEQKGLVNLDQLTNFTNYNKPQPGGWLSKYE